MKTKFLFIIAASLALFTIVRCTSTPRGPAAKSLAGRDVAMAKRLPDAAGGGKSNEPKANELFDEYAKRFGVNVYYANLHAHHYMEYRASKRGPHPDDWIGEGKCEGVANFPADDGRPCRTGASGENEFVLPESLKAGRPLNKLDYFEMACDYARTEGELDILFITPHSKNGEGDGDADTTLQGFAERHAILADANRKYRGDFYCGLGQEASSISKGNHVNIFGHMLTTNTKDTRPFFFPSGAFNRFYPQVQSRTASGEKLILQFNHPDVAHDLYWGPLAAGLKKDKMNDYGIDDFAPGSCLHSNAANNSACAREKMPEAINVDFLKRTFANIREAGGDAYRLVEVTETSGATTNSGFDFRRVHKRAGNARAENRIDDGLLAYIFFLDMGFKVSPTANQDNHFYNYGSAIASRTGVLAPSLAEGDIMTALDNRATFASEDKNSRLLLAARVGGKDILMGRDVSVKGDSLQIGVGYSDADAEGPADLRVYYYHEDDVISYDRKDGPWAQVRTMRFVNGVASLPQGPGQPQDFVGALVNNQVRSLRVPVKTGRSVLFIETTQADRDKMWSAPLFIEAN